MNKNFNCSKESTNDSWWVKDLNVLFDNHKELKIDKPKVSLFEDNSNNSKISSNHNSISDNFNPTNTSIEFKRYSS